jgi:hypothetical protein
MNYKPVIGKQMRISDYNKLAKKKSQK